MQFKRIKEQTVVLCLRCLVASIRKKTSKRLWLPGIQMACKTHFLPIFSAFKIYNFSNFYPSVVFIFFVLRRRCAFISTELQASKNAIFIPAQFRRYGILSCLKSFLQFFPQNSFLVSRESHFTQSWFHLFQEFLQPYLIQHTLLMQRL